MSDPYRSVCETCDALRGKLRRVIAQRNDLLQLVTEIESTLSNERGFYRDAVIERITAAKRKWGKERNKKSGG